ISLLHIYTHIIACRVSLRGNYGGKKTSSANNGSHESAYKTKKHCRFFEQRGFASIKFVTIVPTSCSHCCKTCCYSHNSSGGSEDSRHHLSGVFSDRCFK